MNFPQPVLVDNPADLEECVARCLAADAIAVDTEFVRTDTFYPLLGLIQLSDGEQVWLVDPVALENLAPVRQLLLDPETVKVFHSCSEDLEVLRHWLDAVPAPLFDTQVAAAFLDYGFSRGYSALVEAVLDIQLDKHETRSDWLRRPLSESQLRYAAEDVFYLMHVYRHLQEGLRESERSSYMGEEMADLVAQAATEEDLESYYQRVKGAWKLDMAELAALRTLTTWREEEARLRDRPRNRIVSDKALLEMLKFKPQQVNGLYSVEGFNKGLIRRYGEQLMELYQQAHSEEGLQPIPEPLDKPEKALMSRCRQVLEERAEELGIAQELLAKKKDLEPLVRTARAGATRLPARLAAGWRYAVCGEALYNALSE